jgi:RHS repeat-associated protein
MVALNPDYAPVKTDADPKNRVGRFFSLAAEPVGADQPPSRNCIGGKQAYAYETASGAYYYTKDHLGSIREVVASDGTTVEAVYDYSPWGEVSKIGGSGVESDFLYTGHFYHDESDLHLTLYSAYNPELGMWLSRDPIAENGGINLYAYVGNEPIRYFDPNGLASADSHAGKGGRGGTPGAGFEYSDEYFDTLSLGFLGASFAFPPALIPSALSNFASGHCQKQQGDTAGGNINHAGSVGDALSLAPGLVGVGGKVISAGSSAATAASLHQKINPGPTPSERNANRRGGPTRCN